MPSGCLFPHFRPTSATFCSTDLCVGGSRVLAKIRTFAEKIAFTGDSGIVESIRACPATANHL